MVKIYILCDLEGAAGVVDFESQSRPTGPYYEQARRLATLEVNALVDGLLAGGATELLVLDGHGPGGIDVELLHREARLYMGRPIMAPYGLDGGFDGMVLYGHHAMNNVPGANLAHSWNSRGIVECRLNGDLIGEIGFNMALAGQFGVPTLLISGDRAACEEAARLAPEIESVVVKEGLHRTAAVTLSPAKARELLSAAGQAVMGRIAQIPPVTIDPPYIFRTQYVNTEIADAMAARPHVKRVDACTVEIGSDDLADVCRLRV